jgi:hypothetical protein
MKIWKALKQGFRNMLSQPWLSIMWLVWLLILAGNGLIAYFLMPRSLLDIYAQYQYQIAYPGVLEILSPRQVAWVVLVLDYLVFGTFIGLAVFLTWRKPGDILAVFTSALFIGAGVGISSVTFIESRFHGQVEFAWLDPLQNLLGMLSYYSLGVFIFIFPDGRFLPRIAGRWVSIYLLISLLSLFLVQRYLGDKVFFVLMLNLLILFLGGIASQIYRHKVHSTALQRQQTKFVVLGLSAYPIAGIVFVVLLSQWIPMAYRSLYQFLMLNLSYLAVLLIPLTLTNSIIRYRLWDIDVIIRRTLVYSLLTGLLTLIYFSGVALLQGILTADRARLTAGEDAVSDPPSAVVIVITTLAIAALFNPLRRRVQDFIDRRFYRQKYDAEKALAEFAAAASRETDLEQLSARLTGTVQETLQPEQLSLWMISPLRIDREIL